VQSAGKDWDKGEIQEINLKDFLISLQVSGKIITHPKGDRLHSEK